MVNIPRPRIFITVLIWVVSCCGLLMVWQAPPQLPTLSSSSSSFSSLHDPPSSLSFSSPSFSGSGDDVGQSYFAPRLYSKQVRRKHVSNLLYLQKKKGELEDKTYSPHDKSYPPVDKSRHSEPSPAKSYRFHPKVKPYSKISFRDDITGDAGASPLESPSKIEEGVEVEEEVESGSPLSDPTAYYRSRVKDITPSEDEVEKLSDDAKSELKRLLVQRHRMENPMDKTPRDRGKEVKTNLKEEQNPSSSVSQDHKKKKKKKKKKKEKDDSNQYTKLKDPTEDDYDQEYNPDEMEDDKYYDDDDNDDEYLDDYEDDNYEEEEEEEMEEEDGDEVADDLGARFNVTPADASLLIYNRVPKCASSTMQTILRRLSRHLNFEHVSSLIYDHHRLTQDDQEKLVDNLTASMTAAPSQALSYDRHLYYTNLTGLGLNPPVYINVVRDPVERFISSFYYRRSEERLNRIQMHGRSVSPSLSWVNRTVEQCVLMNDGECAFTTGDEKEMMLSYFCGHQEFCRTVGNPNALQAAKQVVSREYSVVGLVEHMDLSLLLLETLVPRFMDGALQIYENIRQKEHMAVNVNQQKPKVSMGIREELSRRMSDDLDFYYFLEQRLFEQKKNFL